jgi:hypothetical protein
LADRPPDYISWRTDFKILSFGLLNEKVDSNPEFTLAIDETGGACTFQYGSESTTREIVRTVSNVWSSIIGWKYFGQY